MGLGCASMPVEVDIASMPVEDEKKSSRIEQNLGHAGYYYVLLNFKLVDDPKAINRISRIGARLSHYTERPNIEYKYFVINSKFRNAYSISDG